MSDLTRFRDHCRAMARGTGDAARATPAAAIDLFGDMTTEPVGDEGGSA